MTGRETQTSERATPRKRVRTTFRNENIYGRISPQSSKRDRRTACPRGTRSVITDTEKENNNTDNGAPVVAGRPCNLIAPQNNIISYYYSGKFGTRGRFLPENSPVRRTTCRVSTAIVFEKRFPLARLIIDVRRAIRSACTIRR